MFDPATGFHLPDKYQQDEDDTCLPVLLVASGFNARSRSSHTTSRTALAKFSISRQSSAAATSISLLELYESDDDEELRRRQKAWESLHHKSVKRNIFEQVKKEQQWMDSLRSTLSSSSPSLSLVLSSSQG